MSDQTRSHEHEVSIAASVEDVWRTLSDPEEIKKWFAEDAQVEPREGGRVYIKWGEGVDASYRVDTWDPPRRLRLVADADFQMPAPTPEPMVNEYVLEVRGEHTVLRLIHSGIPTDPSWDGFYDGANAGWRIALTQLGYIAENCVGEPMHGRRINGPAQVSPGQGWKYVVQLLGLSVTGERFSASTALGDTWTGRVIYQREPSHDDDTCALILGIDGPNAVFTAGLERMGPGTYVGAGLVTFGGEADAGDALGKRYADALADALQVGSS